MSHLQRRRLFAASLVGVTAFGAAVVVPGAASADPTNAVTQPAAEVASRTVTLTGARHQGLPGQYRAAYSTRSGKLYVTSVVFPSKADGKTVNGATTIGEVDPNSMRVLRGAEIAAEPYPASMAQYQPELKDSKAQHAPFGIAVDDARGLLWTTDTIHDTVSAYDMKTFALVWRSAAGSATHAREIVVLPSGDVVASGMGGLWRVTGNRGSFAIAPYAITAKEATPMTLAQVGGELYVNDASANAVSVVDIATGKVARTVPMSWPTPAQEYFHGQVGVDTGVGVLIAADQGAYDQATKAYAGAGVTFYDLAGTRLSHLDVGRQNVSVAVDATRHLAYVADFGSTEVRVFDLAAAKAGRPTLVGTARVAAAKGDGGVNSLMFVGGKLLAVTKDRAYKGVDIDYAADLGTGDRVGERTDADSLVELTPTVTERAFDPARDTTDVTTQAPGTDLSRLPLYPGATGPVGSATGSLDTGSLDTGSFGGGQGAQVLGSLALLGLGGVVAAVAAGPISAALGPVLQRLGLR